MLEQEIAAVIKDALRKMTDAGHEIEAAVTAGAVEVPPQAEMGDYAFPCFGLAKYMKASPAAIAQQLATHMALPEIIAGMRAQAGYVNFFVNRDLFISRVLEQPGCVFGKKGERVLIEYSSPNIAKPFHIGHLMTTVIGDALCRIYRRAGYDVVGMNYLGDYGTQFGKLIYAYMQWGREEALEKNAITELLRVYVKFHEEAERNPELEEKGRIHFLALEQGRQPEVGLWEAFRRLSLAEFGRIYQRLDVKFDSCTAESAYSGGMEGVLKALRSKGLLEESEGAEVVRLDGYGMPPCIVQKSDGGSIYATRDIAAAIQRYETYHFNSCLYVVGQPQALHFDQVFQVLKLMGYAWAGRCGHVGYPHIRFADKKMSTRNGRIISLEEVLDESVRRIGKRLSVEHVPAVDFQKTAEALGVGAVKYAFLKNSRERDILFDWDEILDYNGNSGPYLQYAYARCQSILQKAASIGNSAGYKVEEGPDEAEYQVARVLARQGESIAKAVQSNEPCFVARYTYELAQSYNRFYNRCAVLHSPRQGQRLALTARVAIVLKECLELLGMKAVEKM